MPRTTTRPSKRIRTSKSLAVREALVRPPRRQLSKWQREQRMRQAIFATAASLAFIVVAVLGYGLWRELVARGNETVAVVYGEQITARQLVEAVRPQLAFLDRTIEQGSSLGQATLSQLRLERERLPQTVLDNIVEDRVVREEARRRGITVSPQEIQDRVNQEVAAARAVQQPDPTPTPPGDAAASPADVPSATPTPVPTLSEQDFPSAYEQFLRDRDMTDEAFRDAVAAVILREKLRDAIGQTVPESGEQVRARHILVSTEEQARDVVSRLESGASFDDLARQESMDSATKDRGGDLGWFPRGIQARDLEKAAFEAAVGKIDIVKTFQGWHVLQVLEHVQDRPLDPAQLDTLRLRAYSEWLTGAMAGPDVRVSLSPEQGHWVLRQASRG